MANHKNKNKNQSQQNVHRLADGLPVAGKSGPPEDFEYSKADNTIVSLWPIRFVVLLVTVVSAAALAGQRIAQRRACATPSRDDR